MQELQQGPLSHPGRESLRQRRGEKQSASTPCRSLQQQTGIIEGKKKLPGSRPGDIFGSDEVINYLRLPPAGARNDRRATSRGRTNSTCLHPGQEPLEVSPPERVIDSRTPPVSLSELKRQQKEYQHVEK